VHSLISTAKKIGMKLRCWRVKATSKEVQRQITWLLSFVAQEKKLFNIDFDTQSALFAIKMASETSITLTRFSAIY
jgi:hypothetical protein